MTKEELNIAKRQFILECAKIGEKPTNKAFNKMISEIAWHEGMKSDKDTMHEKLLHYLITEIETRLDQNYKGHQWEQFLNILIDEVKEELKLN